MNNNSLVNQLCEVASDPPPTFPTENWKTKTTFDKSNKIVLFPVAGKIKHQIVSYVIKTQNSARVLWTY